MRSLLSSVFALALVASPILAVTACTTPGAVLSPTVRDEQALFVLEQAWKGANISVQAAVTSGVLRGENAAKASTILAQAQAAMEQARAAQKIGQAVQERRVLDILAQLQPLLE